MDAERRRLYRHGALILLLSTVLGLVIAAQPSHPAKWMAAHLGGLLVGVLLIAAGAVWPELRLGPRPRDIAHRMILVASWAGLALNLYAAVVNLPGPATEPGRLPDAAWQVYPFFALIAVIVPTTIGSLFLIWRGLWK